MVFFLLCSGTVFFQSGCVSTLIRQKNEYLLYTNTVRGNTAIPDDELQGLIPQKPNRRILRLPISPALWFYEVGARRFDREAVQRELDAKIKEYDSISATLNADPKQLNRLTKRYNRQIQRLRRKAEEGNWLMRSLGEPPAYFREADARNNAAKMQRLLYNHGFFQARTAVKIDTLLGRRIRVNYLITENMPFYLNNITWRIADPAVDTLVRQTLSESLLRKGERYSADNIQNERIRIEELLRNHGYYAFTRQFIPPPDADSARGYSPDSSQRYLDLWVTIANPPGQRRHPIYRMGTIDVRVSRNENLPPTDTLERNGVRFLLTNTRLSTRLMESRILFRPDSLYRIRNIRDTQRQLFLLNQFKFTNINFIDTTNRRLSTVITAIPVDKYQLSTESGLNVNNVSNNVFPGPFVNLGFQVHNVFGGLETFEASAQGSYEFVPGIFTNQSSQTPTQKRTTILSFNVGLTFPHILFPSPYRFRFNRANPRTQISVGYNYTDRPEFRRSSLRGTIAYSWQPSPKRLFNFALTNLNYLDTRYLSGPFRQYLTDLYNQGNPLIFSFNSQLVSSMIFTYSNNSNVFGQGNQGDFFRASLESGGTTLNLFGASQLDQFSRNSGVSLSKFFRPTLDYRYYIPLRTRTTLAFRFNSGLIYTYYSYIERNSDSQVNTRGYVAPYEKLLFGGGSNSVRAWLPRRLGPGSSYPRTQVYPNSPLYPAGTVGPVFRGRPGYERQFDYSFEQPGDVQLELNAELRGRLFHLGADIDGALFLDVGNVWTLRDDPTRQGENFAWNRFYRELAVGTGVGLRIDFSFFIIRLDGGIKVYDPARRYVDPSTGALRDERFILPLFSLGKLSKGPNPLVLNFGIGYPF